MVRDLATAAELIKLARALDTTTEDVAFAASLAHDDIRRLRERVVGALYDEHRAAFQRVAAISRVLSTPVNVRIALRAFPPLLAARIAGEMAPDRAAELANRMPVEYLAQGCVHLDPRRAGPLISRIDPDRVLAVVLELVGLGDYITLGRLLDVATERVVGDVAAALCDEALLRVAFYAESSAQLTRAVAVLPPQRLRTIVACALTGPPDLILAGLALLDRLDDDHLRGRLADHAAEIDDEMLTRVLRTAIEHNALPELLTAVVAMGQPAQRRMLTLPVLTEPDVLDHLTKATAAHSLRASLEPLLDEVHKRGEMTDS